MSERRNEAPTSLSAISREFFKELYSVENRNGLYFPQRIVRRLEEISLLKRPCVV